MLRRYKMEVKKQKKVKEIQAGGREMGEENN